MRKKFRVAVEGQTTDKRAISKQQIQQMASTYDRAKYGARMWMEHFRSLYPDSPFRAYGDVISVSAEEVPDGPLKGKMGLYAEIEPLPELLAMAKAKQKVYFSIEIDPDFAGSGTAYLAGLGFTDTPASLGTDYMTFSSTAPVNPLANRKVRPENMFSTAEAEWDFSEDAPPANQEPGILEKVRKTLFGEKHKNDLHFTQLNSAIEEIASHCATLSNNYSALQLEHKALLQSYNQLSADQKTDRQAFSDFKATLDRTPNNQPPRPTSSGGNGATLTDC